MRPPAPNRGPPSPRRRAGPAPGAGSETGFPCRPAFASLPIMHPYPVAHRRTWHAIPLLLTGIGLALLAGCGRQGSDASRLSFVEISDTTGLSRGSVILTAFEPYRLAGGAMRIRGKAHLPDGTRLQLTVVRASIERTVKVLQVTVQDGTFETAPFMGERGPLPPDLYRFDVLAHFNTAWQPEQVLRATRNGQSLRGPGVTRGTAGTPAFFQREERRL